MDPKHPQPRLDEHLVEGETREEMLRGERIYAAPAREPHAERQFEVCEWSVAEHRFVTLSLDDSLVDPTLARPIPICALLDAVLADDAVVDALDSKGNRRLRAIMTREHDRGLEQGINKGIMEGIESICRILGIELSPERRADLHGLDTAGLERLLAQLETERRWP
jgi:hypothetical protein